MNRSSRRVAIKNLLAGSAAVAATTGLSSFAPASDSTKVPMTGPLALKGNINHSVTRWTYGSLSLDDLCIAVKEMGLTAIDLLAPKEWPTIQKHGLTCSMCYTNGDISLTKGWNRTEYHADLIARFTEAIPLVAKAGYKNLICFSGNRDGMDDETGMKNMAEGIKKIIGLAEKNNVIVQIEIFNSKVNHKDYMGDSSAWAIELCKRIGSENFKILYDIYHMQVQEGDIIATIQNNHQYFGHYHTAGVPGRHEIDETQELYYPAVMNAIVKTGYKGYVAQEFIPAATDKLASLRKAVVTCDV